MFNSKEIFKRKNIVNLFITSGIIASFAFIESTNSSSSAMASGIFEYRWNQEDTYRKLRLLQSSNQKLDRSTYYFFLRKKDRKTAILKLSLKFPEYFKAGLKPKNISLCEVFIGGYKGRTKCLKDLPSDIEIGNNMKSIDIFPRTPVPSGNKKNYAVKLKMFNPRKNGMYQVNAFTQSPGELPVSLYLGSYLFQIE
tara:strand:- start:501 stop:1088 length:588 start_codon:yes stop_codon:yes gene_type:complete